MIRILQPFQSMAAQALKWKLCCHWLKRLASTLSHITCTYIRKIQSWTAWSLLHSCLYMKFMYIWLFLQPLTQRYCAPRTSTHAWPNMVQDWDQDPSSAQPNGSCTPHRPQVSPDGILSASFWCQNAWDLLLPCGHAIYTTCSRFQIGLLGSSDVQDRVSECRLGQVHHGVGWIEDDKARPPFQSKDCLPGIGILISKIRLMG